VIIPGVTDGVEDTKALFALRARYACIEKIELLPFRKLCTTKYEEMGIPFPFGDIPPANTATVDALVAACEQEEL
jgi:pyruvate formate lyase activating enzyme